MEFKFKSMEEKPKKRREFTEEHKRKISSAQKGKNNSFYGKKHSEETKRRMRNRIGSFKGKKHTEEAKRKIGLANKGRKRTEEVKRKMSLASKGRKHTEEAKRKMSLANKGRKCTEEAKRKIGLANKGRKRTEETRKKMSEIRQRKVKNGEFIGGFKKGEEHPLYGKKMPEEQRKKLSDAQKGKNNSFYGKRHSEEMKRKWGEERKGENHPNWKGGVSREPYPFGWNKKLKNRIRKRDGYRCMWCGKTEEKELEESNRVLSVNHIDRNKMNLNERNLITLCDSCNAKEYHYPEMRKAFEEYIQKIYCFYTEEITFSELENTQYKLLLDISENDIYLRIKEI